jgi:hypothetical protein
MEIQQLQIEYKKVDRKACIEEKRRGEEKPESPTQILFAKPPSGISPERRPCRVACFILQQ